MGFRILGFISILVISCVTHGADLEEGCVDIRTITGPYVPPKVIQVGGGGTLYSPGYKENKPYPDNVYCAYQLQAGYGMHIRIHFNDLEIDATDACEADSLSIYDFDTSGAGMLTAQLCGKQIPNDFVSESNAIQLILRTDGFAGRRGFNITYSAQRTDRVCSTKDIQCRNRNCVDESRECDGNDDCGDGTDEENCYGTILPYTDCGHPEIDPVTFANFDRIVGGQEAVPGSWPWMADLQANFIQPNGHICGGALINAEWVLSAAHCFLDEPLHSPQSWRIHLGNHHKFDKDASEQVRYAERIILYENVRPDQLEELDMNEDMALIKLNAPVKFTKYVKPICLPGPRIKLDMSTNCYATGWGATRGTGSSDRLKQANHPIQADVLCKRLVGGQFVSEYMICAGSMGPGNGVCHGDSGGPLVCETSRGQWSIVGVASYVTDGTGDGVGLCGLKGRPSVFNRVTAKTAWIRKTINRYS